MPQSFQKCMSDENEAQQLGPIWTLYSASTKAKCTGEATTAGIASYLDLLTCLQMNSTQPVTRTD
jgi:hypothetical protein